MLPARVAEVGAGATAIHCAFDAIPELGGARRLGVFRRAGRSAGAIQAAIRFRYSVRPATPSVDRIMAMDHIDYFIHGHDMQLV